ncbi:dihydrodipicolinate synthase family protein, partial [Rhizobiaceae sp. 2RAB30]
WLLEAGGCDGINLLGTTGEATSFSVEQRFAAMRAIALSGLPLSRFMVGTGAAAFEDACRLTAEAKALGFAGALLLPPFYYKGIGADALVDYVTAVVDRVGRDGLPLYLYHFPGNSGVPYTPDAVARLRDRFPDTLKGLKDSTGDLDYSGGLARALPGFDVFPSAEAAIGRAAELGLAGCISATANVTGPFAQAAFTGKTQAEREAGLAEAVRIRAEIAKFPLVAAVKEALVLVLGDAAWRRLMPPLTPLAAGEGEALANALAKTALERFAKRPM